MLCGTMDEILEQGTRKIILPEKIRKYEVWTLVNNTVLILVHEF